MVWLTQLGCFETSNEQICNVPGKVARVCYRDQIDTAFSKKVVIVNSQYRNRKELWVQSLMTDNAPAKVVTVWPWRYDKPAL